MKARWVVVWALVGLVALTAFAGGWLVLSTMRAKQHLTEAGRLVTELRGQLERGDNPAAHRTLNQLRDEADAAHDETRGPHWRLGEHLPVIGDDLTAAGDVADIVDGLARRGLPELVEAGTVLSPKALAPTGGRIDVARVAGAAPTIEAADDAIRQAQAKAAAIHTDGAAPELRKAVADLRSALREAEATTGTAARAARLIPAMLGVGGPRTYLVLFQNPAELRATGGMPGAYAIVRVHRGAFSFVSAGSAPGDWGVARQPVLPLGRSMHQLYTQRPGIFPQDVNFSPHFPTAALLAREMYRRYSGRRVDGVIATDPVALSYLLRATGPVPVAGMPATDTLTADNAVPLLLSDVYVRIPDPSVQDQFFATAARSVFGALASGRAQPRPALAALAQAAGERRILMWSANRGEQRLLEGTVLGGVMPRDDGARPTVGVFLNDGSGAKLGYYLTPTVGLSGGACRADGRGELRVRVTLASAVPRGGLPPYVLGLGLSGEPYTARTLVMVFTPTGGSVLGAWLDGRRIGVRSGAERGRGVGIASVDVPPGARRTVEFALLTDHPMGGESGAPRLWTTPGTHPWGISTYIHQTC